ncbi:hypothetical protein WAI453_005063 [Rhynchosporium graminicola]
MKINRPKPRRVERVLRRPALHRLTTVLQTSSNIHHNQSSHQSSDIPGSFASSSNSICGFAGQDHTSPPHPLENTLTISISTK